MRIAWLTLALLDLVQARRFIAQDNPSAAERLAARIEAIIGHLSRHPEMGRTGRRHRNAPATSNERAVAGRHGWLLGSN